METFYWLLVVHFIADYSLQSRDMSYYKNWRNTPTTPSGAQPYSVWMAYMTAHAFIHAGLSSLVVGVPMGFAIGCFHWVQDYMKCRFQYSPNLDQAIHIVVLAGISLLVFYIGG